ncbi:hypothetical protein [Bilophila wadsworthia]|uniref:hypothetical protein n=1 Tax=Bilophila wadsworthia TaxID=35833 RepID=UPI003A88774D
MKLYHGSLIEHLAISNSGTGLGYNFGAVFFARTYGHAKEYGNYVYQCEINIKDIFLNEDLPYLEDGAAGTALREVMAERGIDEKYFDLCWYAVVEEKIGYQDEDWVNLLNMDDDDASWEAQAMRIAFARKLGFKAVEMDDECGSIAVLPEFIKLEAATEEYDEEED